jgi:hypothetical protein
VFGVLLSLLLWFFARRGHRWPKWVVLAVAVLGIVGAALKVRAADLWIVPLDVAAFVVLLRWWPREQTTSSPIL